MTLILLLSLMWQDQTPEIKENIQVSYQQVQVRVQKRDATPVKGLTLKDFVFTRNGETMIPESFVEMDLYPNETEGEAAPASAGTTGMTDIPDVFEEETPGEAQTSHAVAIMLDPGISTTKGFQTMQQAAKDLVDQFPDGTQVSLYQMHYALRTLQPLTSDREMIKTKIDDAVYYSDLWNKMHGLQKSINMVTSDLVTTRLTGDFGSQRSSSLADNNENANVIAAISDLSQLGELLKFKGKVKDLYTNKVANGLAVMGSSLSSYNGDRSIFLLTGGGYVDEENLGLMKSVTSKLNWENIPVHSLHFRDRETKELNLVRMGRLTEEDLRSMQQNLIQGGHIEDPSSVNTLNEDESYLKSSPRTVALQTGGTFVSAFNALQVEQQLSRIRQGSGHYYLVSYKTSAKLDNIDIELRHKEKGVNLHYGKTRGTYVPKIGNSKREKNLDFATTLLYGFEHRETDIRWEFEHFKHEDGTYAFPILGKLSGNWPKGGYEVGMVAINDSGEVMDERKSMIKNPGKGNNMEFYDLLLTKERPMSLRAMIREVETGKSTLQEFPLASVGEGPTLSSLVMVPNTKHEVFAIHSIQKERIKLKRKKVAREKLDPLFRGPRKMIPPTAGPFTQGQPVGLYFHAQDLDGAITQYDLESFLEVDERKMNAPLQIGKVEAIGKTQASLMAFLDTSRMPAGRYKLAIRLKDKRSGATTTYSEQVVEIRSRTN